jgi:hypothetical protein
VESAKSSSKERGRIGHLPVVFRRWQGDYQRELAAEFLDRARKLEVHGGIDPTLSFADINGGAIMDHRTPRERRFVAVPK